MRPATTAEVEALATDLLGKLRLPQEFLNFAVRNLHFYDDFIDAKQPNDDAVVMLDICAEFPLLGAFILVRDALKELSLKFLGENADENLAYLLLRPLELISDWCRGLSQLAGFSAPEYMPEAFRVQNGRLVLCGPKLGRLKIRNGIRSFYENKISMEALEDKLPDLLRELKQRSKSGKRVGQTMQDLQTDELLDGLRKFSPFKPTIH